MRSFLRFVCILTFGVVGSAYGQGFRVISSSPSSGEFGVPLSTEIVFQFNEAVYINTDWNDAFFVEPRGAIQSNQIFLGLDDQGRPAVVEFSVQHQADRDYVWLVSDVTSNQGAKMAEPFVLRYSTAPDIGPYTVGGAIASSSAAKRGAASARPHLEHIADLAREYGLDRSGSVAAEGLSKSGAVGEGHVLVLLLSHYALRSSSWDVRNATVVKETAESYEMDYVRNGTYWPLAIKYADGSTDIEAVGFYDADGDMSPDSVTVNGADESSVSLQLFEYSRAPAGSYLGTARSVAAEFASDQELITIQGRFGTTFHGTAYAWSFEFYSATKELLTLVRLDPLGTVVDTSSATPTATSLLPISAPFIDSDEALQVAEENGGRAFRERFDPENILTSIEAGNLYWYHPTNPQRVFWRIEYASFSVGVSERLSVLVDMYSSVVLSSDGPSGAVRSESELAANHPNPFTSSTQINFHLSTAGHVRLSVYNLLGQEVAVLLNEYRPAGVHGIEWNTQDAPSGIYLYKMETAAGEQHSRSMLLVR